MAKKVYFFIFLVSFAVMVLAGYNVWKEFGEYQSGIEEYEELEQLVSVAIPVEEKKEAEAVEEVGESTEEPSLIDVSLDVNFDELEEINKDFTGWLYYEPLEISYPVVRGHDNEYYTKYTFTGEKNKSGAIFMDAYNWNGYEEYNTFIHGHNMRNKSMFGRLKELLGDENGYIEQDPYFYIFTKDKSYMYEIFAVYNTNVNSDTYNLIDTKGEQEANLAYIKAAATWLSDTEVTADDRIVTLSTCYGVNTTRRTVVQGVLIAEEDK